MDIGTAQLRCPCRICGAVSVPAGSKTGTYQQRTFSLRHCPECHYSFVENPWTDYAKIYSEDYYAGRGADPLVDYVFELEHPEETIRRAEWQGILRAVRSLVKVDAATRWLDYGCGNGGLVRFVREQGVPEAVGLEQGWIADKARNSGIPILQASELAQSTFDVITAIEVLEHIEQPIDALRHIRSLLKPDGILFLTTGNARRVRGNLAGWSYVVPEIHISFFEPDTLARALKRAGFEPAFRGFLPGFADIIRFKMLKNLGVRKRAWWQSLIPWPPIARLVDAKFGVSGHPIGRAI